MPDPALKANVSLPVPPVISVIFEKVMRPRVPAFVPETVHTFVRLGPTMVLVVAPTVPPFKVVETGIAEVVSTPILNTSVYVKPLIAREEAVTELLRFNVPALPDPTLRVKGSAPAETEMAPLRVMVVP